MNAIQHYFIQDIVPSVTRLFYPTMVIVQARMSSTRLPGKVLLPIMGKPLLFYLVERLRRITLIDGIIIATSQDPSDDPIATFCDMEALHCVRGSLDDVLSRMYTASNLFDLELLIRVTGDCPLIDPWLVDQGLSCFQECFREQAGRLDYLSNTLKRTFPRGMDFEIIKKKALEKAYFEAKTAHDKEHVTPVITRHPERFSLGNLEQQDNQSAYRLTVDEKDDFTLVCKLFEELYPKNPEFGLKEIIHVMKAHPDLEKINAHIAQKN